MDEPRVVLLSIRAEWARAILDGEKAYEYRKQSPTLDPPYRMLLYVTGGPSEVWGEVVVDEVVSGDFDTVLDRTVDETPHSRAGVRAYFGADRLTATAVHVTDINEYSTPVSREQLETVIPEFVSPQNFRYISQAQYEQLRPTGR